MKKKIYGIFSIVMSSALAFTGCNTGGNSSTDSSSNDNNAVTVDITDSALIMDCVDSYALEVKLKNTEGVTWTSSDSSVLAVDENGVLTSMMKEGSATITATSGNVSDTCQVTVMVQGNPPAIRMENAITLSEGGTYTSEISISYNGQDILDYVTFEVNAENEEVASATVDGGVITYTGNTVGTAEFSVYTTVFGTLYAEKVSVEVKNSDISYVVAGKSDEGLLLEVGNNVYTSDVSVFYKGEKVDD